MASEESKSYQLRVRVTAEERDLLEKLRIERNRGETLSDLVREGISSLTHPQVNGASAGLSPALRAQVEHLADLLKREPHQIQEACVEGILDLIERRCEVPLIVMETYLHLKYRGHEDKSGLPKKGHAEHSPATEPEPRSQPTEKPNLKIV